MGTITDVRNWYKQDQDYRVELERANARLRVKNAELMAEIARLKLSLAAARQSTEAAMHGIDKYSGR